jgi:acetoacetyl-CoA synthetase
MGRALWNETGKSATATQMHNFISAAGFSSYEQAHQWSLEDPNAFWKSVWNKTGIVGDMGSPTVYVHDEQLAAAQFFPDAQLNVVDTLLKPSLGSTSDAIVYLDESGTRFSLTWNQLRSDVARATSALRQDGVCAGDRVAAWMPNRPETVVLMLAAQSLGAIFTSTSSDFGAEGVIDRFSQTEPVVLLAADAYGYGGKTFLCHERLTAIVAALPSVRRVVVVDTSTVDSSSELTLPRNTKACSWDEYLQTGDDKVVERDKFSFRHPGLILYSSGTTGQPKCIVHKAAGVLLTHLKEQQLHCDVKQGDRVFYFTTCGWMMWNWLTSALATGATIILYDGNPAYPSLNTLFDVCEKESVTLFGTSAKFIDSCRKAELSPKTTHNLSSLRTICSTGSPLNEAGFEWVYEHVAEDVHLASISGGTDLCGCFVGGDPTRPVYSGEIQGPMLGMDVAVFNDAGTAVRDETGELVCRNAFPSIPVGFWGDPAGQKFYDTYFSRFQNTWTHGDFASITPHGGFIIHGRSDATLNVGGVRIGTAEIYSQVESFPEITEAVAVAQKWDDDSRIVLFVRMATGATFSDDLSNAIRKRLRDAVSPRHVPALIIEVSDIPRTRSGKISELAVTDIVNGRKVRNTEALANPDVLMQFKISLS